MGPVSWPTTGFASIAKVSKEQEKYMRREAKRQIDNVERGAGGVE